jgi:hypothetical protein
MSFFFSIPLYVREFVPCQNLKLLLLIMNLFNCRTIILSVCYWLSLYIYLSQLIQKTVFGVTQFYSLVFVINYGIIIIVEDGIVCHY